MRSQPFTVHPAEGDLTNLAAYISSMPGARYVQDQWKDEERRIVLVTPDGMDVHYALHCISEAYPPYESARGAHGVGGLVFWVPETVAEMLSWYSGEDNWFTEELGYAIADPTRYAAALASLWHPASDDEPYVAVERYDQLEELADERGIDSETLRETTSTLWKDGAFVDFDDALEKALVVLDTPHHK